MASENRALVRLFVHCQRRKFLQLARPSESARELLDAILAKLGKLYAEPHLQTLHSTTLQKAEEFDVDLDDAVCDLFDDGEHVFVSFSETSASAAPAEHSVQAPATPAPKKAKVARGAKQPTPAEQKTPSAEPSAPSAAPSTPASAPAPVAPSPSELPVVVIENNVIPGEQAPAGEPEKPAPSGGEPVKSKEKKSRKHKDKASKSDKPPKKNPKAPVETSDATPVVAQAPVASAAQPGSPAEKAKKDPEEVIACEVCSKEVPRKSMSVHKMTHNTTPCGMCSKMFANDTTLQRHIKKTHKEGDKAQ